MPNVHRSQGYRGKRTPHTKNLRSLRLLKRKANKPAARKFTASKGSKGSHIRGLT